MLGIIVLTGVMILTDVFDMYPSVGVSIFITLLATLLVSIPLDSHIYKTEFVCNNCGIYTSDEYCRECGTPKQLLCEQCRQPYNKDDKYCHNCGRKIK